MALMSTRPTGNGKATARRNRRGRPPRYQIVTEALRQQLATGVLSAGVKLPALRELADQFKVSTNTVRNAIRVLEHEGCLYHVPDIGAFVKPTVPARVATRVTVALVTIDIGGALEMGIARGVEQACQEKEWGLQILDAQANAELEARNLLRLADSGTHGAIIMPISDQENFETLVELKLSGYPIVLVDRGVPGLKVDLVESDHERGAYLATRHLLEQGHTRVYMVTDPPTATSIVDRIRGFERAMMEHGHEPTRRMQFFVERAASFRGLQQHKRWLGGYEAALPLLRSAQMPLAIFAHNDYSAWGVLEACRELGLRVPQDVSIVGFDDSEITRAMSPPLTTVAQRTWDIGRTAIQLLEERFQAGGAEREPRLVRIPAELVVRESVWRAGQ